MVDADKAAKSTLQVAGEDFHSLIGTCVVAWADVDEVLFDIFRYCVGPIRQCAIIFYRSPGLDVRLGLTDELVRSVLPPKVRKNGGKEDDRVVAWEQTKSRFDKLLAVRRRIAHQPTMFRDPGPFVGDLYLGQAHLGGEPSFEIYTNQHEKLRGREAEQIPLKEADLKAHLKEVTNLRDRLRRFFAEVLQAHYESPPLQLPSPAPNKK